MVFTASRKLSKSRRAFGVRALGCVAAAAWLGLELVSSGSEAPHQPSSSSSVGSIWLGKLWRRSRPHPSERVAFIRSEWRRKFEKSLNVYLEI